LKTNVKAKKNLSKDLQIFFSGGHDSKPRFRRQRTKVLVEVKVTGGPIERRRAEIQKLSLAPMRPVVRNNSIQGKILPIRICQLSAPVPLLDDSIVACLCKLLVVCPWVNEATI
jgi:hypothetical protein